MRWSSAFLALAAFSSSGAFAAPSGITGGGQPFDNRQPYLAVTHMISERGIFPSRDETPNGNFFAAHTLGMMRQFGGNFAMANTLFADGQLKPIAQNTALFSLIGTFYGGDGKTTYAMPDLRGRTIIGTGQGPGLSMRTLGEQTGQAEVTLTVDQMPAHTHAINVPPGQSGPAGGNQPFDNMQPSLAMTYMIATGGIFQGGNPFIGQVAAFGGSFAPTGWLPADGRLVRIEDFDTLFTLIGTTYGGDGQEFFALPDLRGRAIVGAGSQYQLGQTFGEEQRVLTLDQLPSHDHDGGAIDLAPAGGGQPFDNRQPSLALNYYISLQGIFPPRDGPADINSDTPYLGEIVAGAVGFGPPRGYVLAAGQLLSIAQNQALFAVLGTTYGGDGRVTFALPDLRNRIAIGWGGATEWGETGGAAARTLTIANLPPHAHDLPNAVPEPATWAMLILGFGLAGGALRLRARPTVTFGRAG